MQKIYLRFGEIPENERSKIFNRNEVVGEEIGVSVWDCIEINNNYRVIIPLKYNHNTFSDLHNHLCYWSDNIYLVSGG